MRSENRAILDGAILVARRTGADAVLLAATLAEEATYLRTELERSGARVITATAAVSSAEALEESEVITLPHVRLRRRGRAKVALLEGLAAGLIHPGERVVVISGDGPEGTELDTMGLIHLTGDDEFLAGDEAATLSTLAHVADPAVFDTALGLCIELSRHGRDGRPVGFLATLGDHEEVLARSHPLVLNPFQGHSPEVRCILYPVARRAVREFSGMDGAFVIQGDGVIAAAGRYLQELADEGAVPPGLGSRHRAAAGITEATRCVAFVVSETSGEIRIFSGGRLLMTLSPDD